MPRSATDSCRVVFKIFCSALKTFICGPSYGTDNAMLANIGPSVVHPVVISRKLSKIDPWLLWNTVRKLSPLIQLSHSNSSSDAPMRGYSGFKEKYMFNINTACCSTWRQTTAVVNQARPSSHRRCCQKLCATVGICCWQLSSVVFKTSLIWRQSHQEAAANNLATVVIQYVLSLKFSYCQFLISFVYSIVVFVFVSLYTK